MRKSLIFSLILIGLTAMMGQVLLMRELLVVFYGNELTLGAMLAAWLFWTGIGSWGLGGLADRLKNKITVLAICQVALFFLLPTILFLTRNARAIWGTSPGEITGFGPMLISSFLLLSPLCLILGFLFALGCRIFSEQYSRSVRGIGNVYIFEAVGASIGGLILNFLLIRLLPPFHIVLLIGGINLLAAIFVNTRRPDKDHSLPFLIILGLLLLSSIAILAGGGGQRLETFAAERSWRPLALALSENSIYGNIAVTPLGDHYSFFENGLLMFSTGDISAAEEAAHFPLLSHADPQQVLLIGGGVGGSLGQILKHPLSSVDYVELDPMIIEVAKPFLSPDDRAPLEDSRARIWHVDGRLFIRNTGRRYDVIIVQLPDPSTALLNRFYSLEFFREANQILSPDGLLAFSVSSSENYISLEQAQFLGCLDQTLRLVFSHIAMVPGETCHFLATNRPSGISLEPDALVSRLRHREIQTLFVREYYLPDRLNPWRTGYLEEVLENASEARVNRDFQPVGYLYNMLLWSTYFQSPFRGLVRSVSGLGFWHLALPLSALFLLIPLIMRKRTGAVRLPVLLAMASTGLSEILFQVVTVVGFQVLYGYVYYKLGLILTSFMIGLVVGSWFINNRLGRLRDDLAVYTGIQLTVCLYPLLLALVLLGLAALKGGSLSQWALGGAFAFFPVVAGFIGGLQFPLANKICLAGGEKVGKTAGLIYGLDLLGACAGAFLAGAVLIPVLGILQTCVWAAALNGCVFVLLGISWLRR